MLNTNHPQAIKASYTAVEQTNKWLTGKYSRPPILCDNDENNHTALLNRQPHAYEDVDVDIPCPPTGSIAVVHHKDAGQWMHGTIVEHKYDTHDSRSYKVSVNKMRNTITGTKRHVKTIPVIAEDYLRNDMSKPN